MKGTWWTLADLNERNGRDARGGARRLEGESVTRAVVRETTGGYAVVQGNAHARPCVKARATR